MKRCSRCPFFILAFISFISITACTSPEATKEKYLLRAEEYMAEENWPKARVAVLNVLKIDPKDVKGYYLRAQVAEKENELRNAVINYQKVTELDPEHREAWNKLGHFYLAVNALDKVEEAAEKILSIYPDDVKAETLLAAVMAREDHIDEALAKTESLIKQHPKEAELASLLAALYIRQGKLKKAEKVLLTATAAHPKDISILNVLGITYGQMKKPEQVEGILQKIIGIEPEVYAHQVRLVRFYLSRKQTDKAEKILRAAIQEEPESETKRLALAEFLNAQFGVDKAEAFLLEAKSDLPGSEKIRFGLGKLYEGTKRLPEARAVYEAIVSEEISRPAVLSAQVRLAAIHLKEDDDKAAAAMLKKVLEENPRSSEALTMRGEMALAKGDGKAAVQDFRTVLRDQPELVDIHVLLGRSHLLLGERDLARESLEKAVTLNNRKVNARRFLVWLDLADGSREKARDRLEGILKDAPEDREALRLLLALHVKEGAWTAARKTLTQMRKAGMNPFLADVAEGDLYTAGKDWKKGTASYERAYSLKPDAIEPLLGLVKISLQQGKVQQAMARLRKTLAKRPEHPYAQGILGELMLTQGDQSQAEKAFIAATRINPGWVFVWENRAKLKLLQKNPVEAITVLESGLEANPESEPLRMLLASVLEQTDKIDLAIKLYEKILRKNPKGAAAANNLAFLLADRRGDPKSLEKALLLTQDFEERFPNPFFLDTRAWVYLKTGQGEVGLRLLKEVVEKAPDQALFDYHLGMAYYETENKKEARVYLAKAVGSGRSFSGSKKARVILAEMNP